MTVEQCGLWMSAPYLKNVRHEETLDICLHKLCLILILRLFPRVVLRKLLESATEKGHFLFDSKFYHRIDDRYVAMGLPLS